MGARLTIIVSPYFPPSTLAGVHRGRHLAKHLPAAGWRPIVLCVDEAFHVQRLDPGLAALVPPSVEIVKVGALPARVTRLAGIGEISLRAWRPLRRALFRLLAQRPVDAVLITGSPYFPMLLAGQIRRRFRVPVVLDFQDPWVSAWGAAQPTGSKAGLAHRLATVLEPRALRQADFVTAVSEEQNAQLLARHPWLDAARLAALPIGGDPEDFAALRQAGVTEFGPELQAGFVNLSYVGTYWPRAEPAVRTLFRAFARLRSGEPGTAARIRLNFIGTNTGTTNGSTHPVAALAAAEGVAEAVYETPARVPYLRALGLMARSDGLLLFGSDEPHYTASKIYPTLMSGRPFVSLFHRASSAHRILTAAGGGCALAFADREELRAIEPDLADGLRTVASQPDALGVPDPAVYAPFEARNIAAGFGRIFDHLRRDARI